MGSNVRTEVEMEAVACVGYCRVSTEQQAVEVATSIADQEAAIRALADRLGVEVGRWFRDAGASGATVEGRPAFRELLRWCEEHRRPKSARGWVLVLNDSRFGRFEDPEESAYWRHHLYRLGWVVRFAEGDDVEGDFRTVVRAIGSVQASEYRRNLIANTRRGMEGAARQGFWTRRAPFGYRRQVVYPPGSERVLEHGQRKAENEKVKLTPHPEEAAVVRWAFERYASGEVSIAGLAEALAQRFPVRAWGVTTVREMLDNDAYRGAVVGGRQRDGGGVFYGCEDAHEAIVPPDLWHRVQHRLAKNQKRGSGLQTRYLLSGILRCPYCGHTFNGGGGGRDRTKAKRRKHRRFYRDSGGVRGECPGRIGTIMRYLVDDAVLEVLHSVTSDPVTRSRIEREIDAMLDRAPAAMSETEAQLRAAKAHAEQKRARLTHAIAEGILLPHEAAEQLDAIRAELAEVEARRHALRFRQRRTRSIHQERERILEAVLDFPSVLEAAPPTRRRELVEPWLGRAEFDKLERRLLIGVRAVPAMSAFFPNGWRAPGAREEGHLILREVQFPRYGYGGGPKPCAVNDHLQAGGMP